MGSPFEVSFFRRARRRCVPVVAALAGLLGLAVPAAELAGPPPAAAGATTMPAYWMVAADGGIFAFGGAPFYGSMGGQHLNKPIVGMAGSSRSGGYWEVATDGGIFAFGAPFYGSTGSLRLNKPVVGMAPTPDGGGYWLVASDGGIFAFGDAGFFGSMGGRFLNRPIVGMAATASGHGYWLVAGDGGIFAFGDAGFFGSMGGRFLNQPIVAMAATADGGGYWFTASDGGVFAFGDAGYYGSLGGVPQSRPIAALTSTPSGHGYWFTNSNGAVTAFGDATYWGSAPQVLNQPVVGMAEGTGNGSFTGSSYPSGSYGYDISNWDCSGTPPSPHTIGVVEVEGASFGKVNPCLAAEAGWAGGGLNLYVFLTYGTAATSADTACAAGPSPAACNYGFNTAVDAFTKAQAAGVNTAVAWWLDVEGAGQYWSTSTDANAAMVQGTIDGLRSEGINSVGVYASPGVWNSIVGTGYSPSVAYWAASWGVDPATTCGQVRSLFPHANLPSGPVQLVQFSSPSFPLAGGGLSTAFDNDYAC